MATVIAVANQKGGVAKTTTTIHVGAALAQRGKRVLLVDLDPQGHIAEGFGIVADELTCELSDVLDGSARINEIIIPNIRPNLSLAPSNIRLSDMELTLVNLRFREVKLKKALEPIVRHYDYLLLDCPPNLGLLTVNALIAAQAVLIPMATQFLSMLGIKRLLHTIDVIKHEGNPELAILGILPTRHHRTNHAREVLERLADELGSAIHIFEAAVYESTRFAEAAGQGKTIFDTEPEHQGATAYRAVAEELIHVT